MAKTWEAYEELLADHPEKFTAKDVNFSKDSGGYPCAGCIHFYIGAQAEMTVCEIYRPKDAGPVPPDGTCDFWNDGRHFPKAKKPEKDLAA